MINFNRIYGYSSVGEWARTAHARISPYSIQELASRKKLIANMRAMDGVFTFLPMKDDDLLISGKMQPREYKLYLKQKVRSHE